MANYRLLWLENALGNSYALTDETKTFTFLNTPTGFGFSRNYNVEKVGNSEILVSEEFYTGNVSGELVFYNPGGNDYIYHDYQFFIEFIKAKPIRLCYQTPNVSLANSFYTNILITSVQKGEIDRDGMMKCSITFHKLTPWFNREDKVLRLTNELTSKGKYYGPYPRPAYSASNTYEKGDYCEYGHSIYVCIEDITTAEAWNSEHWTESKFGVATYSSSKTYAKGDYCVNNSAVAVYSSASTYAKGDYAKYSDVIYQCNTAITTAEAWNSDHWDAVEFAIYQCNTTITTAEAWNSGHWDPFEDGLRRPYYYASTGFSGSTIINSGTNEVGFVLTMDGDEITNPSFSLSQNGVVYGVCRLVGTFDYVLINSIEDMEQIYLEHEGTIISSPEQKQDFTVRNGAAYLTWCKLKTGTSKITISGSNIDTYAGVVTVAYKNSYVSV